MKPELELRGFYVSIARQPFERRKVPPGEKLSALVVEDDEDLGMLVTRVLGPAGFSVKVAADRAQVLAALGEKKKPDVVVADVKLPDLNGFDLLARMKAHPTLKGIPVVMLTGDAKRESIVRGLLSGADGYITKPFEKEILARGVKAVLGVA